MKKKVLSLLLVLTMLLCLLPTVAVAADEGTFAELQAEIDNSVDGTVELTKDYKNAGSEVAVKITNDITVDLGGFTIDGAEVTRIFDVSNGAVVTIEDGEIINGKVNDANGGAIYLHGNSKLTLEKVKLHGNQSTATEQPSVAEVNSGSTLVLKDCEVYDNIAGGSSNASARPIHLGGVNTLQYSGATKIYGNICSGTNDARNLGPTSSAGCGEVSEENGLTEGAEIWLYVTGISDKVITADTKITNSGLQNFLNEWSYQYLHVDGGYSVIKKADGYYAHCHGDWEITAEDNVLTATCGKCKELVDKELIADGYSLSVTLEAPTDCVYDGVNAFKAALNQSEYGTWGRVLPDELQDIVITYNTVGEGAPVDAGEYEAYGAVVGYEAKAVAPFVVAQAEQGDLTVTMSDYTYGGTPSDPDVDGDLKEEAPVKFYYNTTNSTEGGTEWKDITGTLLDAGDYYMYAVVGETDNYAEKTLDPVLFTIEKQGIERPTAGGEIKMDGGKGTYTPSGFDDKTMTITGNVKEGIGTYIASVKPGKNYEWKNPSGSETVKLQWSIIEGTAAGTFDLADGAAEIELPKLPSGVKYVSIESSNVLYNVKLDGQSFIISANEGAKAGDELTASVIAIDDGGKEYKVTVAMTVTDLNDVKAAAIKELEDAAFGDDCIVIQEILKRAAGAIEKCGTEADVDIIKGMALEDIAGHLPHHAVYDVATGDNVPKNILKFFASIFVSESVNNDGVSSIFAGILQMVVALIAPILNLFKF